MVESAEGKLELTERLVTKIVAADVPVDDLYVEARLCLPPSDNPKSTFATCEDREQIVEEFPGVHTFCGLTKISYGLPYRGLINQTFLAPAATHGLASKIMNATDQQIYQTLKSAPTVMERIDSCLEPAAAFQ